MNRENTEEKRYTLIYADGVNHPIGLMEKGYLHIFEDREFYAAKELTDAVDLVTANKVTQLVMKAQGILEKALKKEGEE
jgi:hypothetical protein